MGRKRLDSASRLWNLYVNRKGTDMQSQSAEVTEFVIVSGPEVHDYLVAVRRQLRSYLSAAFPQYRFSLVSQEGEGMGFVVVPVVGRVGDGDACEMLEPNPAVLMQIAQVLEGFAPVLGATLH